MLSRLSRAAAPLLRPGWARCFSSARGSSDLPTEADVVVIGGGSLGAAITYHLQMRGLQTVLLEKDELTAGTTWHSAGMLWRLRPSDIDIELHAYTREMCVNLAESTGITSWHENGGLFIAGNRERLWEYQRLKEMGKYYGIDCHLLAPNEISEVHPLIETSDVTGAIYSPTDGTIDPTGIVMAYSKAAKALGAVMEVKADVAKVDISHYTTTGGLQSKKVEGVRLADGRRIKTSQVVNATGAWAQEVTSMVGEKIPLRAIKHAFVITEELEGMHPLLPNVRDHDLSIYLKTQGKAMAIGGYEQNPEFWEPDHDFAFGLFELNFDTFDQNFQGHIKRCPAIESSGIVSTVCGPESFTPDHKPLVGPQPGVNGFFQACGFNSMGMMLGGGIAREVATWICEGSAELDLFSFDVARFHPDTLSDSRWVLDRTHESYAKTYSIVFPQDENLAGRDARKSGMHASLQENGCLFQARHGFERPGWFLGDSEKFRNAPVKEYDYYGAYEEGGWRLGEGHSDVALVKDNDYKDLLEKELTFDWSPTLDLVAEECRAARTGVALFDQSYFGKFIVKGPESPSFVQYLCGADLEDKHEGSVTYTTLLNDRGGVEADLTVANLGEAGYYFSAGGNTMTKDLWWIRRILERTGADAVIVDNSEEIDILSVQGPYSRALLSPLLNISLEDEDFPFSACRRAELQGVPLMCLRLTFVGELGFELHIPRSRSKEVYDAVKSAGQKLESSINVPVRDAGYRAIDSLSAEKNFRHWHADLSNRDTPLEAGLGFTVLKKLKRDPVPDFIGKDALQAQRKSGVKRKLVCLTTDDKTVPLLGMETIWRDGVCVGLVRSTAYGHTIGKTIAYGYVDATAFDIEKITNDWLKAGTWALGDKDRKMQAELCIGAPFDPKNQRVKGIYDGLTTPKAAVA